MSKLPDEIRRRFAAWGRKGGKARARRLKPEERTELARHAVRARWAQIKNRGGNK